MKNAAHAFAVFFVLITASFASADAPAETPVPAAKTPAEIKKELASADSYFAELELEVSDIEIETE